MNEAVIDALNNVVARTAAIAGLGGIALVHALQAPEAFEETTYLGILFIGAILASLLVSAALTRTSDRRAWAAAGGLAASIVVGYVLTRTSGLPDATVDVGNWTEPLGLASLVAEGLVVCVSASALAVPGGAPTPAGARSNGVSARERPATVSRREATQ